MNQTENVTTPQLTVEKLPFMDNRELENFLDQYSLTMSVAELRACRDHYRLLLHRSPKEDEIRLLDSLIGSERHQAKNLCLGEMTTESKLIADVFADVMARRPGVVEDLESPISLRQIADVANLYLNAAEKQVNPFSFSAAFFTKHRKLLLASSAYTSVASTGTLDNDISVGLKTALPDNESPAIGQHVYTIFATDDADETFEERLSNFLSLADARKHLYAVTPVINEGVLESLLRMADGLTFNMGAYRDPLAPELLDLAAPAFGVAFAMKEASETVVLQLAQSMELRMRRVAAVVAGKTVTLRAKDQRTVTFYSDFLKNLTFPRAYSPTVVLPEGNAFDVELSRIGTCTLSKRKHAVIKTEACGENSFHAALYGVLYAFLHCVLIGASPLSTGIACHLTLPHASATRISESLAALLGLYKIQTEFELHGQPLCIDQGEQSHPSLSVVALAPLPKQSTPASAVGKESVIYYLEPLYTEDGIPDFADLKKMLDYVDKLNRDGHVLSAAPTSNDLAASLDSMSGDVRVTPVFDDNVRSRFGGILVESDIVLQGAVVAVVQE